MTEPEKSAQETVTRDKERSGTVRNLRSVFENKSTSASPSPLQHSASTTGSIVPQKSASDPSSNNFQKSLQRVRSVCVVDEGNVHPLLFYFE